MIRTGLQLAAAVVALSSARAALPEPLQIVRGGSFVERAEMVSDLSRADVVCVGEQHDHVAGHVFELELLQALGKSGRRTVLSLEMFERDVQLVVDEYLAGHITESAFLAASRPWANYRTDYRPLVEFCRENDLPVVAANAPRRYVNIVSRRGHASLLALPRDSRRWLPRLPVSMAISEGYDQALSEVFSSPHAAPSAPGMPSIENLKQAQVLWDTTMADSILRARSRLRGSLVMHVCGSMHCERGYGIVERLGQAAPRLRVATVVIRPAPVDGQPVPSVYAGLADYVVLAPANPAVAQPSRTP